MRMRSGSRTAEARVDLIPQPEERGIVSAMPKRLGHHVGRFQGAVSPENEARELLALGELVRRPVERKTTRSTLPPI